MLYTTKTSRLPRALYILQTKRKSITGRETYAQFRSIDQAFLKKRAWQILKKFQLGELSNNSRIHGRGIKSPLS